MPACTHKWVLFAMLIVVPNTTTLLLEIACLTFLHQSC